MLPHTRKHGSKRGGLAIFDQFRAPFVAQNRARDVDSGCFQALGCMHKDFSSRFIGESSW